VMEILRWLGLRWDEGPDVGGLYAPYRQTERLSDYKKAAETLLFGGFAFRCYCTPDEVRARSEAARKEGKPPPRRDPCRSLTDLDIGKFEGEGRHPVLRFKVPDDPAETVFEDIVHGEIHTAHADIEDFSIMRSDGSPLYVLAAAVDDLAMDVTHVVRGEDLLSVTPKQILLYQALGRHSWPRFAHMPLIVGANRQPLSKRHGETSVEWYRDHGYLPEALVNYLALLGWSAGDGVTERFTVDELIELFTLEAVSKNPAAFDVQKLTALNGEKIRALSEDELARRIEPFLIRESVISDPPTGDERDVIRRAVPLIQERMQALTEATQLRFLFQETEPDEKAKAFLIPKNSDVLEGVLRTLEELQDWAPPPIRDAIESVATRLEVKKKDAFQIVRSAVTFSTISPPLFESMELLGRERSIDRIRTALSTARGGR
jgi:glutamyl-tRNA synthetase